MRWVGLVAALVFAPSAWAGGGEPPEPPEADLRPVAEQTAVPSSDEIGGPIRAILPAPGVIAASKSGAVLKVNVQLDANTGSVRWQSHTRSGLDMLGRWRMKVDVFARGSKKPYKVYDKSFQYPQQFPSGETYLPKSAPSGSRVRVRIEHLTEAKRFTAIELPMRIPDGFFGG